MLLNIRNYTTKKAVYEVFNIACEEKYTLIQLVENINNILGKDIKPIFEKERVGDVKHSLAGIEKAKDCLIISHLLILMKS